MAYQGNVAYQLEAYQVAPARRSLSVHEGGGLDVRARNEASSQLAAAIKAIVALTFVFVLLGAARVALTTQTVTLLSQVNIAEDNVARAREARTELGVERSALASTDRIQRIATENYGMVYASEVDTIVLHQRQGEASADDAQPEEAADATTNEA